MESIVRVADIHPYRLAGNKQCLENTILFWKILTSYYGPQYVRKVHFIRKMYVMAMLVFRAYETHVETVKSNAPGAESFSSDDFIRGFVAMLDASGGYMMHNLWSEAGRTDCEGEPESWEIRPLFIYILVFRFLVINSGSSKNKSYCLKFCPVCNRFLPQDTMVCFKGVKNDSAEYVAGHRDPKRSRLLEAQNDLRLRWNAMVPTMFELPAYAAPIEAEAPLVRPPPPPKQVKKAIAKKTPAKKTPAAKIPAVPVQQAVTPLKIVSDFAVASESSEDSSQDDDLRMEPTNVVAAAAAEIAQKITTLTASASDSAVRVKRKYVRRLKVAGAPLRDVPKKVQRIALPYLNSINMEMAPSIARQRVIQHSNQFYIAFYNPLMEAFPGDDDLTPVFDKTINLIYFTYKQKYHIFITSDARLEECCVKYNVLMGTGPFSTYVPFGEYSLADVMKSNIDAEDRRFKESGGIPRTEPPVPVTVHNVFDHMDAAAYQKASAVIHDDGYEEDDAEDDAFNDPFGAESSLPVNDASDEMETIDPLTGDVLMRHNVPPPNGFKGK
jgi:hypothetical protein